MNNILNVFNNFYSNYNYKQIQEIYYSLPNALFFPDFYKSSPFDVEVRMKNNVLAMQINSESIVSMKIMTITPKGDEGYKYTAEEVYEMLPSLKGKKGILKCSNNNGQGKESISTINNEKGSGIGQGKNGKSAQKGKSSGGFNLGRAEKEINQSGLQAGWDDHSRWEFTEDDTTMREVWVKRITDAAEAISIQKASNTRGTLPMFAQRLIDELKKPQTDWRTILNDFLQEEICVYSFSPPDRRFDDSPFYLPDFNGTEISPSDILFMIDTSGSMSDEMVTAAYSEVKGAIDQFNGKLNGWLGFFNAAIIEPAPFANEDEFRIIKPTGGGGTDFQIIFEYVKFYMSDNPPSSIIILTDGFAPFPDESLANDIPVLWLLNNEEVAPPWGKIARIKI